MLRRSKSHENSYAYHTLVVLIVVSNTKNTRKKNLPSLSLSKRDGTKTHFIEYITIYWPHYFLRYFRFSRKHFQDSIIIALIFLQSTNEERRVGRGSLLYQQFYFLFKYRDLLSTLTITFLSRLIGKKTLAY